MIDDDGAVYPAESVVIELLGSGYVIATIVLVILVHRAARRRQAAAGLYAAVSLLSPLIALACLWRLRRHR